MRTRYQILLSVAVTLVTMALSVRVLRLVAPRWFEGRVERVEFVQVDERVPPFFDLVFAPPERGQHNLPDPHTGVRGQPLFPERVVEVMGFSYGPHDILGFRNRQVPVRCDVIAIGDSLTYGIAAELEEAWPCQLQRVLQPTDAGPVSVYNMGANGWGPVQYLHVGEKALRLGPRVLVVAIYSGNDFFDACYMATYVPLFADLLPDRQAFKDLKTPALDLDEDREWPVEFRTVPRRTIFTPDKRLQANAPTPRVLAGVEVTREAMRRLDAIARKAGVELIVTVLPTKEFCYQDLVRTEQLPAPPEYLQLIEAESANIRAIEAGLRELHHAHYEPLHDDLRRAATAGKELYPVDTNGHPNRSGYALIAELLQGPVAERLP